MCIRGQPFSQMDFSSLGCKNNQMRKIFHAPDSTESTIVTSTIIGRYPYILSPEIIDYRVTEIIGLRKINVAGRHCAYENVHNSLLDGSHFLKSFFLNEVCRNNESDALDMLRIRVSPRKNENIYNNKLGSIYRNQTQ